ncbi:hypothetical protein BJG93_24340 [Paraburkholderia sprentiae WSM5005]|uniref:Uncharacterized protein n=1 Tax=Paraburkholderia sprentiae WSM5005 TaxID=754502 RepID=A0A1I9YQK8_9BURK|nr:hypothetical protein [Paraburkholderia sprentiae]APA88485.1 hypothetical protein BJG93_24340 [Paraburkholderia sprentiae WSM5005]
MSTRHNNRRRFDADLPEFTTSEGDQPTPGANDDAMRVLQRGSEAIVRLATQAHAAVARSDEAAAQAARQSLETQLTFTTALIDELLFGAPERSTLH